MNELIVVIDDEEDLIDLLEYNLKKAGFGVVGFTNSLRVEQFLEEENVDLLIVDRNLIHEEGAVFVQNLRQKGFNHPVIFLTAKDSKADVLSGFEAGADDYISKPFDMDDLIARIKAILRRTKNELKIYKFKDIYINTATGEAKIGGTRLNLTNLEMNLMVEFIKNKNIILSREYLLDKVWEGQNFNDKTVNIAITRLRQKLGKQNYIISIRSQGYKLC